MDWKKIVKEIPEKEQLKKFNEWKKKHKTGESCDGFVETWRKKFKYKGISFELAIFRYFDLKDGFKPMINRISDRHVVVEYSKETKKLHDIIYRFTDEFLWYDTLHLWNDNQTLEEQLDEAYEVAIKDIDNLSENIDRWIKEREKEIDELKKLKKKIKRLMKNE